MPFLTGHFLVASPHLLDPNFVKSVVLLVQHNKDGALGLVVNRPIEKTVQDLWREVGGGPCENRQPVYLGGPVPGPLMAIHTCPEAAEIDLLPGIFFSASKQNLDALVAQNERPYKIFLGNSGWGAGQLESELEEGAWLSLPATPALLFHESTELWNLTSRQIGRSMLESMLNIKQVSDDPRIN